MILFAVASIAALLPGIYTNEEQVYFAGEAGKLVPPWTGLRISRDEGGGHMVQPVDAFDKPVGSPRSLPDGCFGEDGASADPAACAGIIRIGAKGLTLRGEDGTERILDRARRFTCWAAIRKRAPKADGGEDWHFVRDVRVHDGGGRALVRSEERQPQTMTLRMRNVAWSSGPNRPSLVLYVHTDDPARAVAYAWADPDASRVGVNLRWMQASCTRQDDPSRSR